MSDSESFNVLGVEIPVDAVEWVSDEARQEFVEWLKENSGE